MYDENGKKIQAKYCLVATLLASICLERSVSKEFWIWFDFWIWQNKLMVYCGASTLGGQMILLQGCLSSLESTDYNSGKITVLK